MSADTEKGEDATGAPDTLDPGTASSVRARVKPFAATSGRRSSLLLLQQELATHRRLLATSEREVADLKARLAGIPLEIDAAKAEAAGAAAALEQRVTDAEARRLQFVTAPIGGRIAALPVVTGQTVNAGATVAVIYNADVLLGPVRGVGLVFARSVPAVIYTIPPTSPIYYVTYVQIYDATPEVVYVGYTPGYLGTVVAPDGVVVYGTGYDYDPWVGNVWYAAPETYGIAAQPIYSPVVGYSYGYGMGLMTPVVVGGWGVPYYYGSAYHGYPCCGSASGGSASGWSVGRSCSAAA